VGTLFARDYLEDALVEFVALEKAADHNAQEIERLLVAKKWDLVISSGPDIQHKMVSDLVDRVSSSSRCAYTNNAVMGCGEGVCGACEHVTGGRTWRACKVLRSGSDRIFV